jgi:hypothetical protein
VTADAPYFSNSHRVKPKSRTCLGRSIAKAAEARRPRLLFVALAGVRVRLKQRLDSFAGVPGSASRTEQQRKGVTEMSKKGGNKPKAEPKPPMG